MQLPSHIYRHTDNVKMLGLQKVIYFNICQGWAANSTSGVYGWHLLVFTGLENILQVANTGKYWQIDFFTLKYSRNLKQDDLKRYN